MQSLRIEVDGRALRFGPGQVVRIGRSIDADVVLSAVSVSRAHAELRPSPGGWVLVDVGSAGGTYVDGAPVTQRPINGRVVIQCGPAGPGATLTVIPEEAVSPASPPAQAPAAPPAPAPPADQLPPLPEHTSMRQGQQHPPGPVPPVAPAGPGQWGPPQLDRGQPGQQPGPQPQGAPAGAFGGPPPGQPYAGQPPAQPPSGGAGVPAYEMTMVPGQGPAPFPGAPRQATGPDLLVVAEGKEYRFRHPATVTVGRLPDNDVVIDDPAASRQHARIHPTQGGWVYQNLSREGSYADGRPIQAQPFDEKLDLRLGHPVAGPQLSLIPILSAEEEVRRFARKRRKRTLKWVAIAAAAVVLVAGTILTTVLLTGGGEKGLSADDQHRAMAATVLISYEVNTGQGTYYVTGSGSIISKSGLILTNAHVAAPSSPGLEQYSNDEGFPDPQYLDVHLTHADDGYRTGAADYRAKVVVADGHKDVAVIQVYAKGDGEAVDKSSLNLPTMPLGDSDKVNQGDDVTILGFPAIAQSAASQTDPTKANPEVTVTKGVIATIVDEQRSEFDTDARISSGNSGGAAINDDGELIGIPSSVYALRDSPGESGRIRPLDYVKDLISQAEAK